ncbi:NUDIX hydrolase [Mobilicoccus caccae]|uniref:NUDIX hydrolase n=1 Tax=Mobilicoccus caccae TaxID=1859295 RepID=A0ABQ6IWK6_9MICO|nr:NUDIX hydrolase [Mobilicoccus caccae]GMA42327.1 NUDIX hydrolase [Mobilicoccus caccae]
MSTPPTLHADITEVLTRWTAPDIAQDALRHTVLAFLAARPDAHRRTCAPGHITASTVVLSADRRRTLLTLHARVGRWLQLGGHLEDDATLADAARREAVEESGFEVTLDPDPVDLHCHPIVCKGYDAPTRHLDVRFVAVAPAGARERISEESTDLRWFDVEALPDVPPEVALLIGRAVAQSETPSTRLPFSR